MPDQVPSVFVDLRLSVIVNELLAEYASAPEAMSVNYGCLCCAAATEVLRFDLWLVFLKLRLTSEIFEIRAIGCILDQKSHETTIFIKMKQEVLIRSIDHVINRPELLAKIDG